MDKLGKKKKIFSAIKVRFFVQDNPNPIAGGNESNIWDIVYTQWSGACEPNQASETSYIFKIFIKKNIFLDNE